MPFLLPKIYFPPLVEKPMILTYSVDMEHITYTYLYIHMLFSKLLGKNREEGTDMPQLLVTCRIEGRDENYAKPKTMYTHKKIEEWIEANTHGNRQIVHNFLMAKAIQAIEAEGEDSVVISNLEQFVEESL